MYAIIGQYCNCIVSFCLNLPYTQHRSVCLIYDDEHIVRHTLHWHNLLLIRGHDHTLYHCVQLWLVFLILITVHVVSPRLRPCRGELFWWVASSEMCRRKMWAVRWESCDAQWCPRDAAVTTLSSLSDVTTERDTFEWNILFSKCFVIF